MVFQTYNDLLGEYKLWAGLFKDAVASIPRALEDDSWMFFQHADRLRLKCDVRAML